MRHAVVIPEMQDFVDQIQVTVMKGVQKVGEAFFATKVSLECTTVYSHTIDVLAV